MYSIKVVTELSTQTKILAQERNFFIQVCVGCKPRCLLLISYHVTRQGFTQYTKWELFLRGPSTVGNLLSWTNYSGSYTGGHPGGPKICSTNVELLILLLGLYTYERALKCHSIDSSAGLKKMGCLYHLCLQSITCGSFRPLLLLVSYLALLCKTK